MHLLEQPVPGQASVPGQDVAVCASPRLDLGIVARKRANFGAYPAKAGLLALCWLSLN